MTVNQKIAWSILAAIGILTLLTLIAVYLMIGIAWQEFQRSAAQRDPAEPLPSGFTLVRIRACAEVSALWTGQDLEFRPPDE